MGYVAGDHKKYQGICDIGRYFMRDTPKIIKQLHFLNDPEVSRFASIVLQTPVFSHPAR